MQRDRQRDMLQTIFSFFLGLMVAAFVGVGVNTFLPTPKGPWETERVDKTQTERDKVYRDQERLDRAANVRALTAEETAERARIEKRLEKINEEEQAKNTEYEKVQKAWARNTSIVLILFATLVMAVSLVRSEQLRVISNGLLLGGLFTMIYGTGWSIASGDDIVRFAVISFALLATIGLGYFKFVHGKLTEPDDEAETGPAPRPEEPAEQD